MKTETELIEFEGTTPVTLKLENRAPKPRNVGSFFKLGKGKEMGSPRELCQPILDFWPPEL